MKNIHHDDVDDNKVKKKFKKMMKLSSLEYCQDNFGMFLRCRVWKWLGYNQYCPTYFTIAKNLQIKSCMSHLW